MCLDRADRSAFHVKTVYGRVHILPVISVNTRSVYKGGGRTLSSMIIFKHLHVRVIGEAVLADGREVGSLPSGAVEILLDLRRHYGVEMRKRYALSLFWQL